jgi:putative transcriptional regulator
MTITHHPGDELLLAYASGASDEAVSLIVATHLAFCPPCRRAVGAFERAGGAILSSVDPVAMSALALPSVLSRLDEPLHAAPSQSEKPVAAGSVPEPLRSYIGGNLARGWIAIAPGIAHRPLFRRDRTRARLIRAEPGRSVAVHTHRGQEFTLVLSGGFSDAFGHYGPGDLQSTTPDITHRPVADPGENCINLAVTDAPLVFQGMVPKLVGKIFGF